MSRFETLLLNLLQHTSNLSHFKRGSKLNLQPLACFTVSRPNIIQEVHFGFTCYTLDYVSLLLG